MLFTNYYYRMIGLHLLWCETVRKKMNFRFFFSSIPSSRHSFLSCSYFKTLVPVLSSWNSLLPWFQDTLFSAVVASTHAFLSCPYSGTLFPFLSLLQGTSSTHVTASGRSLLSCFSSRSSFLSCTALNTFLLSYPDFKTLFAIQFFMAFFPVLSLPHKTLFPVLSLLPYTLYYPPLGSRCAFQSCTYFKALFSFLCLLQDALSYLVFTERLSLLYYPNFKTFFHILSLLKRLFPSLSWFHFVLRPIFTIRYAVDIESKWCLRSEAPDLPMLKHGQISN